MGLGVNYDETSDNGGGGGSSHAVEYVPQYLSLQEKRQAQNNINVNFNDTTEDPNKIYKSYAN